MRAVASSSVAVRRRVSTALRVDEAMFAWQKLVVALVGLPGVTKQLEAERDRLGEQINSLGELVEELRTNSADARPSSSPAPPGATS